MPGIGSLIREIDVKISEIWESKQTFAQGKTKTRNLYGIESVIIINSYITKPIR